jgi:hypothetical protein
MGAISVSIWDSGVVSGASTAALLGRGVPTFGAATIALGGRGPRGAVASGSGFRYGLFQAPVAQLDRVQDSESWGRRFKSCRVRQ